MGHMLYITGEVTTDKTLTNTNREAIEELDFRIEGDDTISFIYDSTEGCCPFEDYVLDPLKELLTYLEKRKIKANGEFSIESECSDDDNITIRIINNTIEFYNTEIINASDEELIGELQNRGYKIVKGG